VTAKSGCIFVLALDGLEQARFMNSTRQHGNCTYNIAKCKGNSTLLEILVLDTYVFNKHMFDFDQRAFVKRLGCYEC